MCTVKWLHLRIGSTLVSIVEIIHYIMRQGAIQKIRNTGVWVGIIIFVTVRYKKYGGWGSKCGVRCVT